VTDNVLFRPWSGFSFTDGRPHVLVLSPVNNSRVEGIVSIKGILFYSGKGAAWVEISIAGGQWIKFSNSSSWEFQLDTDRFNGKNITVRFRASGGGNYSEVQTLNLILGSEEGGGGETLPGPALTVTGAAAVSLFGLAGLAYLLSEAEKIGMDEQVIEDYRQLIERLRREMEKGIYIDLRERAESGVRGLKKEISTILRKRAGMLISRIREELTALNEDIDELGMTEEAEAGLLYLDERWDTAEGMEGDALQD